MSSDKSGFIRAIRKSAEQKIIYTLHAVDEMNAEEDMITADEVQDVICHGEIIEDYPEDKRGHSFLVFGISRHKRPVHVVCAPKDDYLAIITAYVPTLDKWQKDYVTRRKERN